MILEGLVPLDMILESHWPEVFIGRVPLDMILERLVPIDMILESHRVYSHLFTTRHDPGGPISTAVDRRVMSKKPTGSCLMIVSSE